MTLSLLPQIMAYTILIHKDNFLQSQYKLLKKPLFIVLSLTYSNRTVTKQFQVLCIMICSAGSNSHWVYTGHIYMSSRWCDGGYSIWYNFYMEATVYGCVVPTWHKGMRVCRLWFLRQSMYKYIALLGPTGTLVPGTGSLYMLLAHGKLRTR